MSSWIPWLCLAIIIAGIAVAATWKERAPPIRIAPEASRKIRDLEKQMLMFRFRRK